MRIPGKTFLLGEYSVLQGGPAIVACTDPCFHLGAESIDKNTTTDKTYSSKAHSPFHPESPAGKFINDHPKHFQEWHFTWTSPYPEGGFGGSTAEFLACFRWHYSENHESFNLATLYKTYLKYAYNGVGIPPSGADLIAQTQKNIAYVHGTEWPETFEWTFPNITLLLLKTPYKLPTHEHLTTLGGLPDLSALSQITQQGLEALKENNAQNFIDAINHYAKNLAELGLTAEPTLKLMERLKKHSACLAIKGCGALGADVIAVLVDASQELTFLELCEKNGFIRANRRLFEPFVF